MLPHIYYQLIARYPKPFIGMSNITTLCWHLWQKANIPTINGLNLHHFAEDTPLSKF
ncbi:MAG: LD-carboxypeptidase [Tolypothrix sp. T3-bin4]|nr:LD-carboxypeptidase [Tolypothrix sp. T3-bin4]